MQLASVVWASFAAASGVEAVVDDDVFLPDLVVDGGVEQLFLYDDFYAGLQDWVLLLMCYLPRCGASLPPTPSRMASATP